MPALNAHQGICAQKNGWTRRTNLSHGSAHKGPGAPPPSAAGTATAWQVSSWGIAPCGPHESSLLPQADVHLHRMATRSFERHHSQVRACKMCASTAVGGTMP